MITKEEILRKIQEWAKENDGRTPGEKIIREELGIPKWAWISHWSKTSDIQREAGLSPQVFDNTKYTKEELCDLFIKLIREKKKWPSRDELDFKRRQDSEFPASATFYKQLGLTRSLAQTLLKYIKEKQEYEDITDICNSVLEKQKETDVPEGADSEGINHGWVYLIKHGNRKEYRIGSTTNPMRRLGENRIELPEGAEPIHSIETLDKTGVESYWHNRFKSKQMNGDWFKLIPEDIKEFKRWKKIY